MSQYRLLWTGITRSKKIKAVSGTKSFRVSCHLLYTWLMPFADDEGRMVGDPIWVLANVVPYEDFTMSEIEKMLTELDRVNLLYFYIVEDEHFIEICDFEDRQRIRKDRFKSSTYPVRQPSVNQVTTSCQPSVNLSPTPSPSRTPTPSPSKAAAAETEFEEFFTQYGRYGNYASSLTKWKKLSKQDRAAAFQALPKYLECKEVEDGYKMKINNWIGGQCWKNEYAPKTKKEEVSDTYKNLF